LGFASWGAEVHFEIRDVDGHWYWALVAGTGLTIARSKAFETKEALFHDIRRTVGGTRGVPIYGAREEKPARRPAMHRETTVEVKPLA
jgi:uncharacterized protein YegP (UPF0339 family)